MQPTAHHVVHEVLDAHSLDLLGNIVELVQLHLLDLLLSELDANFAHLTLLALLEGGLHGADFRF